MVLSLTYSPSLQESIAILADNISKLEAVMAKFIATSVSNTNTTKTDIAETTTQVVTQIPVVKNFTNINPDVTTQTPSLLPPPTADPTHETPQITHNIAIFNFPQLFTPTTAPHVIATIKPSTMLDSISNKTLAPLFQSLATIDIQANSNPEHGFHCIGICYHGHKCYPPKFVFLQTEPKPPWKPHDTWYTTMSLEDKTRF